LAIVRAIGDAEEAEKMATSVLRANRAQNI
jgi:hypothetical protein